MERGQKLWPNQLARRGGRCLGAGRWGSGGGAATHLLELELDGGLGLVHLQGEKGERQRGLNGAREETAWGEAEGAARASGAVARFAGGRRDGGVAAAAARSLPTSSLAPCGGRTCSWTDLLMGEGNLPALLRPGPSRRGICLMTASEARKAWYDWAARRSGAGGRARRAGAKVVRGRGPERACAALAVWQRDAGKGSVFFFFFFLPSFLTSFLFLLSFLRSSTVRDSTWMAAACSQCLTSPSTHTCAACVGRREARPVRLSPRAAREGGESSRRGAPAHLHARAGDVGQLDRAGEALVLLGVVVLEADLELDGLHELARLGARGLQQVCAEHPSGRARTSVSSPASGRCCPPRCAAAGSRRRCCSLVRARPTAQGDRARGGASFPKASCTACCSSRGSSIVGDGAACALCDASLGWHLLRVVPQRPSTRLPADSLEMASLRTSLLSFDMVLCGRASAQRRGNSWLSRVLLGGKPSRRACAQVGSESRKPHLLCCCCDCEEGEPGRRAAIWRKAKLQTRALVHASTEQAPGAREQHRGSLTSIACTTLSLLWGSSSSRVWYLESVPEQRAAGSVTARTRCRSRLKPVTAS